MLLLLTLLACPHTPPPLPAGTLLLVQTSADLKGAAGVHATVVGTLERHHPDGEAADGTAIVLRDGTAVYVSESGPPAGWDWMLGTEVRVQGVLWEKAPDGWPVPKLLEAEAPMPADVSIPM